MFPGKKEKAVKVSHEDAVLYEGYECDDDSRTTWCILIENLKSLFPSKKEKKSGESSVLEEIEDTLESKVDEAKETLESTFSTVSEKIKSLINSKIGKKEDEIIDEYEKAKNERDFIRLFNLGNSYLEKKE
jgi:hypothetical protein